MSEESITVAKCWKMVLRQQGLYVKSIAEEALDTKVMLSVPGIIQNTENLRDKLRSPDDDRCFHVLTRNGDMNAADI